MPGFLRKNEHPPWLLPPLPGETADELRGRRNQAYFDDQRKSDCAEWVSRMEFDFDVSGLRILDFGCGHGALTIHFAELGAKQVVGVDLDQERIAFAETNLEKAFPQFRDCVEFRSQDIRDMQFDGHFDLIVAKDSFEHIDDLAGVVSHLHRLLRKGGYLAPGFSPLFYSPFGDHGRFEIGLPWLHAVLPDSLLAWWLNFRTGSSVSNSSDLGLNRLTSDEFRRIFGEGMTWDAPHINYNRGGKKLLPLFNAFRRIPFFEKYFTVSIYAVVRKAGHTRGAGP